jgi:N-acetylglutamate synthase-like GNAT family acetyltransferase
MITIRQARIEDAEEICSVLIRSIRELCGPEYNYEEAVLAYRCENKTPENIRQWIQNPKHYFIVAKANNAGPTICGVALLHVSGEVQLCYLLPEYLHQGIGKQLMESMVTYANELGLEHIELSSTLNARPFYERQGFTVVKNPTANTYDKAPVEIPCTRMIKNLAK